MDWQPQSFLERLAKLICVSIPAVGATALFGGPGFIAAVLMFLGAYWRTADTTDVQTSLQSPPPLPEQPPEEDTPSDAPDVKPEGNEEDGIGFPIGSFLMGLAGAAILGGAIGVVIFLLLSITIAVIVIAARK